MLQKWHLHDKKRRKPKCFLLSASVISFSRFRWATAASAVLGLAYHNVTRFSFGIYILSPSFTSNASYHMSMCGSVPFTRQRPRE